MTRVEACNLHSAPSAIVYVRALRPAAGEATLRPLARLALLQGWTTVDQGAYERWRRGEADVAEVDGEASDGALALKAHSENLAPNTEGADETTEVVAVPTDHFFESVGRITQVGISNESCCSAFSDKSL